MEYQSSAFFQIWLHQFSRIHGPRIHVFAKYLCAARGCHLLCFSSKHRFNVCYSFVDNMYCSLSLYKKGFVACHFKVTPIMMNFETSACRDEAEGRKCIRV